MKNRKLEERFNKAKKELKAVSKELNKIHPLPPCENCGQEVYIKAYCTGCGCNS